MTEDSATSTGLFLQDRLFPNPRYSPSTVTQLSILDATVARFSACGAIWLFDRTPAHDARDPALFKHLRTSLERTLASYPHWTGQLRWATRGDIPSTERHAGRLIVEYGTPDDPGAAFSLSRHAACLEDLAPAQSTRRSESGRVWNATSFPQHDLVNQTKLALHDLTSYRGLPGLSVQLTSFACGGYGVALQLSHPLADAHALAVFVHQWASTNQALSGIPDALDQIVHPVFDPTLLQAHAFPITCGPPNTEKKIESRSLPKHRFDWWGIEDRGYPSWALENTRNNMSLLPSPPLPLPHASPAPWHTWDVRSPVEHVFLRFSSAETLTLRTLARSQPDSIQTVSRLDALLAHMWLLISNARALSNDKSNSAEDSDPDVYLNLTLGARTRVSPPLPETFIGSPIFIMNVSSPLSNLISGSSSLKLSTIASQIRGQMNLFTPAAVSAHLHDTAHEEVPQRLWGAFMGRRHTLVTSWTRLQAYKVDFWRSGVQPRLVRGIMPPCDGLMQVMDTDVEGELDVSLHLEAKAMRGLLGRHELYSVCHTV